MPGLWFEEFEIGKVYSHPITRTVTEMDNMMFSCLTMNPQPLHIDRHFAAQTEWGQPLMNSLFTLGLMIGISVNDLTLGTTIANLGMTDVKFPAPLFQGDTVHVSRGPVAAMVAIKQLGTNGGGFFGVNSSHPLENPNYITNIAENISILLIPVAMVFALGFILKRKRFAWMVRKFFFPLYDFS